MVEYRKFQVGDQVQVVDVPYWGCPFTWVDDMTRMCEKLVTISDKSYSPGKGTYAYRIEEDGGRFIWCGNCFMPLELEEEPPEIEDESFLSAIRTGGGETT